MSVILRTRMKKSIFYKLPESLRAFMSTVFEALRSILSHWVRSFSLMLSKKTKAGGKCTRGFRFSCLAMRLNFRDILQSDIKE